MQAVYWGKDRNKELMKNDKEQEKQSAYMVRRWSKTAKQENQQQQIIVRNGLK